METTVREEQILNKTATFKPITKDEIFLANYAGGGGGGGNSWIIYQDKLSRIFGDNATPRDGKTFGQFSVGFGITNQEYSGYLAVDATSIGFGTIGGTIGYREISPNGYPLNEMYMTFADPANGNDYFVSWSKPVGSTEMDDVEFFAEGTMSGNYTVLTSMLLNLQATAIIAKHPMPVAPIPD